MDYLPEVFNLMRGAAFSFLTQDVDYSFTKAESDVINLFFTNKNKKIFSIRLLPDSMKATLLSMYSRLKNERGIRGHFVDNVIPVVLASKMGRFKGMDCTIKGVEKFLDEKKLRKLDAFICFDNETEKLWNEFYRSILCLNSEYYESFSNSKKINDFLSVWLGEKFGHNSIARMASVTICFEEISVLAAKSIEWVRPGSGFIELSTRFVSMESAKLYPVWEELKFVSLELSEQVKQNLFAQFDTYRKSMSDAGEDSFEDYLCREYTDKIPDSMEFRRAIDGEKCDVLGNILPCATLTSVGVSLSGEAVQGLLKHLLLDKTPENYAIYDLVVNELKTTGNESFVRHVEISQYERNCWKYIDIETEPLFIDKDFIPWTKIIKSNISDIQDCHMFPSIYEHLSGAVTSGPFSKTQRGPYEKLPATFETLNATFLGRMSFRSWRDLHRHGFCMHLRTLVTPKIGFYRYHKGVFSGLSSLFDNAHREAIRIYEIMNSAGVSDEVMQYCMPMGCFVGFVVSANLREWEFIEFQRTKHTVNDEVRKVVIFIGRLLREKYPGWDMISRADKTFIYAFARTKNGIPIDAI